MDELKNISISLLNSSSKETRYLVSVGKHYFEANALTAELLTSLKEIPSQEEGIKKFLINNNQYSFEQIKELVDNILMPKIQIIKKQSSPFIYQHNLLNKEQICKVASHLSVLFNKYFMANAMFVFMALDINFFIRSNNVAVFDEQTGLWSFLLLMVLIVLSSVFHELGHASACWHCGVEHGGIGLGLYINFPVLYTDVTDVWKLPRKKRCLVNFAGVYFQCIILIVLILLYETTHYFLIRYLILIINFGFLITLNPFFKFDGYWMISDILGVANLRQRSNETIKYIAQKLLNPYSNLPYPYLLQLRLAAKIGFSLYAIIVNFFLAFYICYLIPMFVYRFAGEFPEEIYQLVLYLSSGVTPPFSLLRNIFTQSLFFSIIIFMLVRMIKPYIDRQRKHYTKDENSKV